MKYQFPAGMRPATVEDRAAFYSSGFDPAGIEQLQDRWPQVVPVVDVGTESTRYRPQFKQYKGKLVRLQDWETLQELRQALVEYAPEDLYYRLVLERPDRVEVDPERELVFDLDPEEIDCKRCGRMHRNADGIPRSRIFCLDCFTQLAQETRQLYSFLEQHFDDLLLVYSGRGFHIHVRDDAAFRMDRDDRRQLATKVADGFPIDRGITAGDVDVVRLPGSLHGLVSRVVTALEPAALADPERIITDTAVPDVVERWA